MFKSSKTGQIISAALTVVLGTVMLFNPLGATELLCRITGIILTIAGLISGASFFLKGNRGLILSALLELGFGIWLMVKPGFLIKVFTIILGGLLILHAVNTLLHALDTKRFGYKLWWGLLALAVVTAALGIVVISAPFASIGAAMAAAGVCLIGDGALNIILTAKAPHVERIPRSSKPKFINTTGREK